MQGDNKSKERAEKELQRLHETIAQKEGELERIKPQYEEMKKREEECTREYVDVLVIINKIPLSFDSFGSRLGLKEQKRKELYAKQGRGSQFTSRDQRDLWIQNELKSLSKAIKEKNEQIERLQEDLKVGNVTWTLKVRPILIGPFLSARRPETRWVGEENRRNDQWNGEPST